MLPRVASFLALLSSVDSLRGPTLVVGATGKVGRQVVSQLVQAGKPVRALVRNATKAGEVLAQDSSLLTVFTGDLHDEASLRSALLGCDSVVAVSGTTRLTKFSDFLPWRFFGKDPMHWCNDMSHP